MVKVVGTKGTLILDWGHTEIVALDAEGNQVTTRCANPKSEGWRLYQNIADHLVKAKPLVITGEWARRPIHILDLAHQSSKKGRALKPTYK